MSNSSSHMKSQARQLEEKLRANEQMIEKKPQTHFFLYLPSNPTTLFYFLTTVMTVKHM